ncbi:BSD domain containing protein [Rhynchospora pubera]|uniref:BSD domain containing protein n=1 Tax=Rhynchospora pubera TaxID=906938 RepID=A0AAV8FX05_9POAL|nr:BSD domain containing protein [Rhynchospora pubera]
MSWSSLPWPFRKGRDGGDLAKERSGKEGEDEEFGITDSLLDFVTTFTVDTFKSYPLNLNQGDPTAEGDRTGGAGNVRTDLTQWQQQHAVHILSKAKEISKLRYDLCPRHMKDKQFWTIYFLLVKTHIAPYEIRAIQKAKLKSMETSDDISQKKAVIEVEMMESNNGTSSTGDLDDEINRD